MIECMRNATSEHMTLDEQISFCEEKSKNIKLKAKPQTFVDIKNSLEKLKELKVNLCLECGCCSYVCPAKRHLVTSHKMAKKMLREKGGKK